MGLSLGFGKNRSKSVSQDTTAANPMTSGLFMPAWSQALGDLSRPAQAYGGQIAPGLDPLQARAMGLAAGNVGAGAGAVGSGIGAAGAATQYRPATINPGMLSGVDLSGYMNPYVSNVVDQANRDLDLQRRRAIDGQDGQFTRAGAWGGSRQGVADALTNEAFGRLGASTDASLLNQGYQSAQGSATADLNRAQAAQGANQQAGLAGAGLNLNGAGMLGALGLDQNRLGAGDAQLLAGMGGVGQQTAGAQDQGAYQDWLRQQALPLSQAGMLANLLKTLPDLYAGAATTRAGQTSGSSFKLG